MSIWTKRYSTKTGVTVMAIGFLVLMVLIPNANVGYGLGALLLFSAISYLIDHFRWEKFFR
jgi:hypothetical protein